MSPGLLFLAYGVIVIMAMYVFVYIPNKKKHRKMQEMHDSIVAGYGHHHRRGSWKGGKKEGDYLTLVIDEEKEVTMRIVLYAVNQKIDNRIGRRNIWLSVPPLIVQFIPLPFYRNYFNPVCKYLEYKPKLC